MAESSNVELIERGYRAWHEDDLDGFLELVRDDASYHTSGVFPGFEDVYEGKEGIARWWGHFHEPWERIDVIPERIVERGDKVFVRVRFEGIGREGIETSMRFINIITMRDGLALRFDSSSYTPETARELGLED